MIIEVAAELGDNHTLEEWLKLVGGDESDSRRKRLKKLCIERVEKKWRSLEK
jgi:hypothetical protein